jgi:hypothetical protein
MERLILVLLLLPLLQSCVEKGTVEDPFGADVEARSTALDSTSRYSDKDYQVYTLEGCEYIVVGTGRSRWGSHKGNCKNHVQPVNYQSRK